MRHIDGSVELLLAAVCIPRSSRVHAWQLSSFGLGPGLQGTTHTAACVFFQLLVLTHTHTHLFTHNAQVLPYLNFVGQDPAIRDLFHGVINRQVRTRTHGCILWCITPCVRRG
jgi:hypothetical protein